MQKAYAGFTTVVVKSPITGSRQAQQLLRYLIFLWRLPWPRFELGYNNQRSLPRTSATPLATTAIQWDFEFSQFFDRNYYDEFPEAMKNNVLLVLATTFMHEVVHALYFQRPFQAIKTMRDADGST